MCEPHKKFPQSHLIVGVYFVELGTGGEGLLQREMLLRGEVTEVESDVGAEREFSLNGLVGREEVGMGLVLGSQEKRSQTPALELAGEHEEVPEKLEKKVFSVVVSEVEGAVEESFHVVTNEDHIFSTTH